MAKWEYEVMDFPQAMGDIETKLTNAGKEGWELVSVFIHPSEDLRLGTKAASHYFAVFKRPATTK